MLYRPLTLTCWPTDCRIQMVRGPSGDEPIYCCPFTRMSFLTDSTLLTLRATSTALLMSARELTKPLNCTTPLKVSTLISADFSEGSPKTAAFTLVVMTVSSRYSPVPSCLGVEAHPRKEISRTAKQKVANRLNSFMAILLMHDESAIPLYRSLSMNGHDQEVPLTTCVATSKAGTPRACSMPRDLRNPWHYIYQGNYRADVLRLL